MQIFVTGATGFVGMAVTQELIAHGHQVLGLARSESAADRLRNVGAEPLMGDLETPHVLRHGAKASDAIVHTGFIHDFSRFADACAIDRSAIDTIGTAIIDAQKPFIVTAGVAFLATVNAMAVESDPALPPSDAYPRASDATAKRLSDHGILTNVMRLPPSVHGHGDHGFVPILIDFAKRTGRSAYIGAGDNVWPAVHVNDAGRAFRLAVERGPSAQTYHAVAESGIPFRVIAKAIADGLGVPCVSLTPDEARDHFGSFFNFVSIDQPTSGEMTKSLLNWDPVGPGLITDMAQSGYFQP
jgi:nucleoside-diphosphate-sugar epimerase